MVPVLGETLAVCGILDAPEVRTVATAAEDTHRRLEETANSLCPQSAADSNPTEEIAEQTHAPPTWRAGGKDVYAPFRAIT